MPYSWLNLEDQGACYCHVVTTIANLDGEISIVDIALGEVNGTVDGNGGDHITVGDCVMGCDTTIQSRHARRRQHRSVDGNANGITGRKKTIIPVQ